MKRCIIIWLLAILAHSAMAQLTVSLDHKTDCVDENKSKIWATATGGTPPYQYSWDGVNFGSSDTLYVPIADTYTVTVRDASMQTAVDNISAGGLLSLPFFNPEVTRNRPNCALASCVMAFPNDTFPNNVPGYAQGPYKYEWSTGGSGDTLARICNLDPFITAYSVTITSSEGCTITVSDNISWVDGMTIDPIITKMTCNSLGSVSLIGGNGGGGIPPHTANWSWGMWGLGGQATGLTLDSVDGTFGDIIVLVTDAEGCWVEETLFVELDTVTNFDFNTNKSINIDTCNGTACMQVDVTNIDTSLLIYSWRNLSWNSVPSNTSQACVTVNDTYVADIYSTISVACEHSDTFTINIPQPFTINNTTTPVDCGSTPNGTIMSTVVGGLPPYTFSWSNGLSGNTLINLAAGTYEVTVIDASGCSATASAVVQADTLRRQGGFANNALCPTSADGSVSIILTGGEMPYTYLWSNGDTDSLAQNLLPGPYTVTVTDVNGCSVSYGYNILNRNLGISTQTIVPVDCATEAGGAARVTVPLGTAPFTYLWSNGSTADTAANLAADVYNVTVTDANGCIAVTNITPAYQPSCLTLLRGKVYFDRNLNCSFGSGDVGIKNKLVTVEPGYAALTDASGNWQVSVRNNASYQVYVSPQGVVANDACGIDTLTVNVPNSTTISNINFPKNAPVPNDVALRFYCGTARPGFAQTISVSINNYSLNSANISGMVTLDAAVDSIESIITPAGIAIDSISNTLPRTIYFKVTGLAAQGNTGITITVRLPVIPQVQLGQILQTAGSIQFLNYTDQNINNNSYTCSSQIVGAYDPNDKQVFSTITGESIDGPTGINDTVLRYLIRFQNTGTDTAFNVLIKDTLHANLDIHTFHLLATSHPVEVAFRQDSIIHFKYNNILLPDSNVNEPKSHGFVEFEIGLKDAALLDELTNQASIFFDYNPPIYTNTVATQRNYLPCLYPAGSFETLIAQTICYGDNYMGHTASGTYRDTVTLSAGCDSISVLTLTVLPENISTIAQTICPGQSFEGYNTAGIYRDTLTAANGCDSIRILNLTLGNVIQTAISQTVCFGDSYAGYSASGVYSDTMSSAFGCDSIRVLSLTVLPQNTSNITQTICGGQSFEGYHTTGIYTDTLTAGNGCDSIRILNLTVGNLIQTAISQTVCYGDSYLGYSASGTYSDTLQASSGCDSVRTLTLTVSPAIATSNTASICDGESYFVGGANQTVGGIYTDSLTASTGCDSLVSTVLTVNPLPTAYTIIQNGNILSATGSGAATYQWYQNGTPIPNAETDTIGITTNGTFTVEVTDANNCSTISLPFDVTGVSVGDVSAVALAVYPNPTSGSVVASLGGHLISEAMLYNSIGQLVTVPTIGLGSNRLELNANELAAGVYLLRIRSGAYWYQERVVIAK